MQQAVGKAGFGFQRMAERVAEVEQRAHPGQFLFVGGDNPRLGRHAARDGADAGLGIARDQCGAVDFAPVEEIGIVDQAIFDHFCIARAYFARGQGIERGRVGQHQRGLVERAHEVLARCGVDRGLASDARIDLREQGRRHLDKAAAALDHRCGKSGQIADHPAPQRQHAVAPFDIVGNQEIGHLGQKRPRFGGFARRQHQPVAGDPGRTQRRIDSRAPRPRDVDIGHDRQAVLTHKRAHFLAQPIDQARRDAHVIGRPGNIYADLFGRGYSHASIAFRIMCAVTPWGWCALITRIGAWA